MVRTACSKILQSKRPFQGDFKKGDGLIANCEKISQKLVIKQRKVPWKHNIVRTNLASHLLPGSKAANNREIARDRNVNANSANARNKAVVAAKNVVAVNKVVVSKADDRPN